jgi:thiol-disulfide isomerase/thioredoxin
MKGFSKSLLGLVVLIAFFSFGCTEKLEKFSLPALNKQPLNLTFKPHFKDQVVVVNVFATWCPPCNEEAPELNELARVYSKANKKVQFLMIDLDPNESPADVKNFLNRLKIDTVAGYDFDLDFLAQFPEMRVIPQTFIFNAQGQLAAHIIGVKPSSYFKKTIDSLNP